MSGISNISEQIYCKANMKLLLIILLTLLVLNGCSNREVYNALQNRECVEDGQVPNCDRGQPSYDDYRDARKELNQ